ncbi:MAG TPA: GMC family oxidoreductase [Acidobacteriaceae bacterium]|nr:GMC family oxidoreductase [Acidobacteriaceae bacterium]
MAKTIFDICIVGSGAGGGTLAGHLAQRGVNVAIVEGGPVINTRTDFNTHALPFDFANRHIPTMKTGKYGMASERARGVGGKTMLWNAVALRLSHRDFKGYTIDGAGADWPIDYPDMAPYYDRIETEVGVCGDRDGLEDLPDGIYLDPPPLKSGDLLLQRGAKQLGITIIKTRKATRTRPSATRPACHYCGNCMAGCDVAAKYNSADVHLNPAMKTGHLTVFSDSVVREVVVSTENRATGVSYLNRLTGEPGEIHARCVAVACACIQSVGLLLMSESRLYPNGLANSSGQLGRNFIPHFNSGVEGFLTDLIGRPVVNDEGYIDHAYLPSYMHAHKRDYARSFGVQIYTGIRRTTGWAREVPGFGASYKQAVKQRFPAYVSFQCFGEMIPNSQSYIELDKFAKDEFGLYKVNAVAVQQENERKIYEAMNQASVDILQKAGGEVSYVSKFEHPAFNHQLGGCRMGSDPRTSVVNAYCQTHDVPNLYVVDGSVFPSSSEKNPTLTIMALAARAADNISDRFRKGEI